MGIFVNKRTFEQIKKQNNSDFGGKYYQADRAVNLLTISIYRKIQKINESQTETIYSASERIAEGDAYRMMTLRLHSRGEYWY